MKANKRISDEATKRVREERDRSIVLPSSLCAFVASSLIFLTSCASQPKSGATPKIGPSAKLNTWLASQPLDIPSTVYRVAPPDKIKIVAPGIKELDAREGVVGPDGKISLNLVGEVKVAGLTPGEISEIIAQKLTAYYKADTIDVSVQVTEFNSQHFYVFGQVEAPGIKPYTGRDTIVKVLADAQINAKAWPQKIVIVRPNEDANVHQRVTIDVKQMYEQGHADQNYLIEAGDVVYVPLSPVAEVSETVLRIISPIVPATQVGLMAMGI